MGNGNLKLYASEHARGTHARHRNHAAPLRHLVTTLNSCMFVFGEEAMTFTIHASENGQSVVTVRISPAVAVDKARGCWKAWGGKFTLPIQLGTSLTPQTLIGFH